ncbi:glutamate racemase [Corallococcus sp. CA053C]|uniref:glutamate racemase n=1 Tax=Corallococcus sp. CA053C TaxID=2316732 RepID=UPI000EA2998A|nr:glutamate racemase [Corallococcus sp. CA053C]RKH02153.1 glutamate racemase [Corallococcus sp. CA053C]
MRQDSHGPIGVFDSGIGGLTVLKALMARLPHERTLYLGDTARVPYGTKSGEVVTRYSLKNAEFLLERGIKLLVVACNTASAAALPALSATLPVPVLGVIGTPGTIRSGAYQRALEAGQPNVSVKARACPLFVPLAEEGWTTGDVPLLVAREYLAGFARDGVDTLVLGCTHYPLLKGVIAEVVGPHVSLVDSAEATAEAVAELLGARGLLAPESSTTPEHAYFVTDVPERFVEVGARFLGRPIPSAEQVDLRF